MLLTMTRIVLCVVLAKFVHPIIAEAATQFQSRAISELYPADGPVRTVVVGEMTDDLEEQANSCKRLHETIRSLKRCQSSSQILTKCFFHLPLVGQNI
jgi:hypothetical protein